MSGAPAAPAARRWILRVVPALDSLRSYGVADARADLVAGLTVAAIAVPQAMAYAMVAGVPVEYGLYTAIAMTAVGAVFDSSKQLINGPTNAISIAVLSAIAPIAADQRIEAAILLAFLVGAIQLGITLLRLGDLTRYISHSVILEALRRIGLAEQLQERIFLEQPVRQTSTLLALRRAYELIGPARCATCPRRAGAPRGEGLYYEI